MSAFCPEIVQCKQRVNHAQLPEVLKTNPTDLDHRQRQHDTQTSIETLTTS